MKSLAPITSGLEKASGADRTHPSSWRPYAEGVTRGAHAAAGSECAGVGERSGEVVGVGDGVDRGGPWVVVAHQLLDDRERYATHVEVHPVCWRSAWAIVLAGGATPAVVARRRRVRSRTCCVNGLPSRRTNSLDRSNLPIEPGSFLEVGVDRRERSTGNRDVPRFAALGAGAHLEQYLLSVAFDAGRCPPRSTALCAVRDHPRQRASVTRVEGLPGPVARAVRHLPSQRPTRPDPPCRSGRAGSGRRDRQRPHAAAQGSGCCGQESIITAYPSRPHTSGLCDAAVGE